jgi:hypothetical protein
LTNKSSILSSILKPKTENEIVQALSKQYGTPFDSDDANIFIKKIFPIISIINSNSYFSQFVYFVYEEVKISNTVDVPFNWNIREIKISSNMLPIHIDKRIISWNKIYNELIEIILKNSLKRRKTIKFKSNNFSDIINKIYLASFQTFKKTRSPANFLLINPELKNILDVDTFKLNHIAIIEDQNLKGKIIIGRKIREEESGIHLFIYNGKFCIKNVNNNAKNNYICIKYEIE